MDDFESFTRERIARLRAEAEALEKTLKEYMSTRARKDGASRRSGGDNPRSGAFGAILEAIAAAGTDGLSLDEMIAAAAQEGFSVNRNTLRSQLWQAKKEGLVDQVEAGRYRAPQPTAAEAFGGGFSSAPPEHVRHAFAVDDSLGGTPSARVEFSADLDDEIPF